jgi:hypothetical protein
MPKTENDEPNLAKLRNDSEAPTFMKSKSEIVEPKREIPKTDTADPSRANVLRAREAPRCK